MDRLQTLVKINYRHIPRYNVIIFTGHATVDSAVSGMVWGVYGHLVKPCDLDTILEQIYASVGWREAEGGLA